MEITLSYQTAALSYQSAALFHRGADTLFFMLAVIALVLTVSRLRQQYEMIVWSDLGSDSFQAALHSSLTPEPRCASAAANKPVGSS